MRPAAQDRITTSHPDHPATNNGTRNRACAANTLIRAQSAANLAFKVQLDGVAASV